MKHWSDKLLEMVEKIDKYISLVREYGDKLDLSSQNQLNQFETAVERTKVLDSYLQQAKTLLDVGSGVGIPGIPIAIRFPNLEVTLCEIRTRRSAFLERVVSVLELKNAKVVSADVKTVNQKMDAVTAQAVGSLANVYKLCKGSLKENSVLLCIKGLGVYDEIEEVKRKYNLSVEVKDVSHETKLVITKGFK